MPLPGQFTLYSNVTPTLPAGKYKLRATQGFFSPPNATVDPLDAFLDVTAPRYVLPPDQILSTFPPHRAAGAFSTRLPQIVLRRRTLPWERRGAANQPPEMPWLALVVLADGEAEFKTGIPIAQCVSPGVSMPGRVDSVVGDALTVSNRIRHRVFPALDEVNLLAHVRRVDLTDTELALGDDDGWLGVVVANRLPQPDTAYTAFLISLENQIGNLGLSSAHKDHDTATSGAPQVPLEPFTTYPVLAHWSFACVGSGDFQSLMQGLDVGMLGTLPQTGPVADKPAPPPRPKPLNVLATGHVAVDHTSRDGEPGQAWYRGPLVPFPGTRDTPGRAGLRLMHSSDEARRIGPDGRENLALATAFEIGRLLALAEPSVVAALLLWRKEALNASRAAALLAAEPRFAALDGEPGQAVRAGLELLTALGADGARRLGVPIVRQQPEAPAARSAAPAEEDGLARLRTAVERATERVLTQEDGR